MIDASRAKHCRYEVIRAGGWLFLGRRLRLTEDYQLGQIRIRAGHTWDGASLLPLGDGVITASLVHDWLYRYGDRGQWRRRDADELAMDIAAAHGGNLDALAAPLVQPALALCWRFPWIGSVTGWY